jgi:hypothetical protein
MTTPTRFQAMRMIWIDGWLDRSPDIGLNRRHLCLAFDISIPQAAADLKMFNRLFLGRMAYNPHVKAYFSDPRSRIVFDPWQHEAVFAAGRAAAEFKGVAG